MKKYSLFGVILAVILVLALSVPVFAWSPDDFDVTDISSSQPWISTQPEANASSTTVSVTVHNDTSGFLSPPLGKVEIDDFDVSRSGLTVSSGSPSGWQQCNQGQDKTFTWNVGVGTATDGKVNVDAEFDSKWGYSLFGHSFYFNGGGADGSENDVFGVDSTDPTATITTNQTNGLMTLNINTNDNLSGVKSVDVKVDGQPYNGQIGGVGSHTIDYTVTDNAGNQKNGTQFVSLHAWFAGNSNGIPHYCWKCGTVIQSAWLQSQVGTPGFFGWDNSTVPGKLIGICAKCGNR